MAAALPGLFLTRLVAEAGNIASNLHQYPPFGGYTGAVCAAKMGRCKLQGTSIFELHLGLREVGF